MNNIHNLTNILHNNNCYPLYLGFHGDNPENFNSISDIKNKTITYVPKNLYIIHVFKHGQCGYSDNKDEKRNRKILSNPKWIFPHNLSETHNPFRKNIHLYLPGDPIYNQDLQWDWSYANEQNNTPYDIFELDPKNPHRKFQQIKNPYYNRKNIILHPNKKVRFIPGGKYISKMLLKAWVKENNIGERNGLDTNLHNCLQYISKHSPSRNNHMRVVYLYNCSPHNNHLLRYNIKYYCELEKIKHELHILGKKNWSKFLRHTSLGYRITRSKKTLTKIFNNFTAEFIDDHYDDEDECKRIKLEHNKAICAYKNGVNECIQFYTTLSHYDLNQILEYHKIGNKNLLYGVRGKNKKTKATKLCQYLFRLK
jgi:hypothetical protein